MLTVPCVYFTNILYVYKGEQADLSLWGAGYVLVHDLDGNYTGYH